MKLMNQIATARLISAETGHAAAIMQISNEGSDARVYSELSALSEDVQTALIQNNLAVFTILRSELDDVIAKLECTRIENEHSCLSWSVLIVDESSSAPHHTQRISSCRWND